jgi:hypothetical protein
MSSAALAARDKMIAGSLRDAPGGRHYRTDDVSDDNRHNLVMREILRVNPTLGNAKARALADRITDLFRS